MYRISLKDVGENRVTKDLSTHHDILAKVELVALEMCKKVSGYSDLFLMRRGDGEYEVRWGMVLIGSFTITKLH